MADLCGAARGAVRRCWREACLHYPIVERGAIRVAYTTSVGDPSTSDAFARLEQIVPLKGNRFYATFDITTKEYRACVALRPEETAAQYGLPEGVLAGGSYASAKLAGAFADIVRRIAPTFQQMRQQHSRDPARLPIEFYKRHCEIVLYLPVLARPGPSCPSLPEG